MGELDTKLRFYEKKLLDMSLRNPMLNLRDTKSSTIRFINPSMDDLWKLIVQDERKLTFPYAADPSELVEQDPETSLFDAIRENERVEARRLSGIGQIRAINPSGIDVGRTLSDQNKVLRNLRRRAKNSIDELGINTLFLSFGFLEWTESETSVQIHSAPLVLVPVTLSQEAITLPFVLELSEDEPRINPTLAYKLDNDFGIKLPDFDMGEDLQGFLRRVDGSTRGTNWKTVDGATLSILSFQKLAMYEDLVSRHNELKANPFVKALGGDTSMLPEPPEPVGTFDHDSVSPDQAFEVVDADSSQLDAIRLASAGVSFVLQGPPGTGKSQTITNIIADNLARGRKVLFVSEKRAALDVVYRRLRESGLEDFCLVLHGTKAHRSDMLKQLRRSVDLAGNKVALNERTTKELRKLESDRQRLNDYAKELYEVIEPLHITLHDAFAHLAAFEDTPDIKYSPSWDIETLDSNQLNECLDAIDAYAAELAALPQGAMEYPWDGIDSGTIKALPIFGAKERFTAEEKDIRSLADITAQLPEELTAGKGITLRQAEAIAEFLTVAGQNPGAPLWWAASSELNQNLLKARLKPHTEMLPAVDEKKASYENIIDNAASLVPSLAELKLNHHDTDSSASIAKQAVDRLLGKEEPYAAWEDLTEEELHDKITELASLVCGYQSKRAEILESYDPGFLDFDSDAMFAAFTETYKSGLKRAFSKSYKADLAKLQSMFLHHQDGYKYREAVQGLTMLKDLNDLGRQIEESDEEFRNTFTCLYRGTETDISVIDTYAKAFCLLRQASVSINELTAMLDEMKGLEASLYSTFGDLDGASSGKAWENKADEALTWLGLIQDSNQRLEREGIVRVALSDFLNAPDATKNAQILGSSLTSQCDIAAAKIEEFICLYRDKETLRKLPVRKIADRVSACVDGISTLELLIPFAVAEEQCREVNVGNFIDACKQEKIAPSQLHDAFEKSVLHLWLEKVLPNHPAVAQFSTAAQGKLVNEFRELDRAQFNIARKRIQAALINSLPNMQSYGDVDERSILKRELRKQRRVMPTRKLFAAIPDLLLQLKPCLMMSPLSVSMFLEAKEFVFDLVIFDEASQVRTQDALGAISRGKQVIIAGDSKQLPPTSFFDAASDGVDTDEQEDAYYEGSEGFDSVLDEAYLLQQTTLTWHYRSRDESLIDFSNRKIYDSNLVTFPSDKEDETDWGVEFFYVPNGVYRGSRNGNPIEAERVADLVFEHFRNFGETRSLGVIAFGMSQENIIERAILKRRLENPEFEPFFAEDKQDPFFIKNLESVQGDERDTIILSVGYGKDSSGKLPMRFGPINLAGGERRLNVAVTRARLNIKVVSSMLSTDIDVNRTSNRGPQLLRDYLDFAKNGSRVLDADITDTDLLQFDSPFEEAVYDFLTARGYDVASQVGCSGYRIDLAVRDPKLHGRFVIGIECDGASYHSARTARDRDRLRQDVLEGMGWTIYRILNSKPACG